MLLVIASTLAFLASLLLNLDAALCTSFIGSGPELPAAADRHLVLISSWAFLVASVWGFNARWLPVFLGLRQPHTRGLLAALATLLTGVISGLAEAWTLCALLPVAACVLAVRSLHVFEPSIQVPKVHGIHPSFPYFVRGAYVWLLAAAGLFVGASLMDRNGGIGGASRHALTVGFLATMVFSIGPRILARFLRDARSVQQKAHVDRFTTAEHWMPAARHVRNPRVRAQSAPCLGDFALLGGDRAGGCGTFCREPDHNIPSDTTSLICQSPLVSLTASIKQ